MIFLIFLGRILELEKGREIIISLDLAYSPKTLEMIFEYRERKLYRAVQSEVLTDPYYQLSKKK